jgi:putative DNA primase/helicase
MQYEVFSSMYSIPDTLLLEEPKSETAIERPDEQVEQDNGTQNPTPPVRVMWGSASHDADPSDWFDTPSAPARESLEQRAQQILNTLLLFVEQDQVVELRCLEVSHKYYRNPHVESGFFDYNHLDLMAQQAAGLTDVSRGVYFTLNPLNKDLLARRCNRIDAARSEETASDKDVLRRRWLLIDVDAKRLAGISASDEEKARAFQVIETIGAFLRDRAWPDGVLADSGNGFHLLYRVDLPCDDGGLVKGVLAALAKTFNNDGATIDTSVFNPARIVRLYGTLARKGDEVPGRPHRSSKVLQVPGQVEAVPQEKLQALVVDLLPAAPAQLPPATTDTENGDLEVRIRKARAYLAKVPGAISGEKGHNKTFYAACRIVQLFKLSEEEALPILKEWNLKCQPPWTEKELRHKLEDAVEKADEAKDDDSPPEVVEADDDPHRLARLFLDRHRTPKYEYTLHCWNGDWYAWDGIAYRPVGTSDLKAKINAVVKEEFDRINQTQLADRSAREADGNEVKGGPPKAIKVTENLVRNVVQALSSQVLIEGNVEQPAWLDGTGRYPAGEMLATKNRLVHLPSFLEDRSGLIDLTPRFFTSIALDYAIDPDAPPPAEWLNFLLQIWPGDPESIQTLQEWAGYCLLPDTSLQKILFLLGPPRSGKGTIAGVLRKLVGESNFAGPTLSSLQANFGLSPLVGKLLAVISDARLSHRADQGIVVERLLAISGEDAITVDRKNREPVTLKLPTRLMITSNELPKLNDAAGALASRLLVLQMSRTWLGKEDPDLPKRLERELPGIFLWACDGLKRLRERGHFAQPASGEDTRNRVLELSSPVTAFVQECGVIDPKEDVLKTDLYVEWKTWCTDHGYESGNDANFGKNLLAAYPQVNSGRLSRAAGRQYRYVGIGILRLANGLGKLRPVSGQPATEGPEGV